jgi:hypothetical protein
MSKIGCDSGLVLADEGVGQHRPKLGGLFRLQPRQFHARHLGQGSNSFGLKEPDGRLSYRCS